MSLNIIHWIEWLSFELQIFNEFKESCHNKSRPRLFLQRNCAGIARPVLMNIDCPLPLPPHPIARESLQYLNRREKKNDEGFRMLGGRMFTSNAGMFFKKLCLRNQSTLKWQNWLKTFVLDNVNWAFNVEIIVPSPNPLQGKVCTI